MIGALNSATDTVGKLDKNCIANLVAITLIDKAEMFNIDEEERPGTGAFETNFNFGCNGLVIDIEADKGRSVAPIFRIWQALPE